MSRAFQLLLSLFPVRLFVNKSWKRLLMKLSRPAFWDPVWTLCHTVFWYPAHTWWARLTILCELLHAPGKHIYADTKVQLQMLFMSVDDDSTKSVSIWWFCSIAIPSPLYLFHIKPRIVLAVQFASIFVSSHPQIFKGSSFVEISLHDHAHLVSTKRVWWPWNRSLDIVALGSRSPLLHQYHAAVTSYQWLPQRATPQQSQSFLSRSTSLAIWVVDHRKWRLAKVNRKAICYEGLQIWNHCW